MGSCSLGRPFSNAALFPELKTRGNLLSRRQMVLWFGLIVVVSLFDVSVCSSVRRPASLRRFHVFQSMLGAQSYNSLTENLQSRLGCEMSAHGWCVGSPVPSLCGIVNG